MVIESNEQGKFKDWNITIETNSWLLRLDDSSVTYYFV